MPDADDGQLVETYGALGAGLVVYGHIHRPFVRRLEDMVVANSGSVGLPWDGDPRASYLVVSEDDVHVARVAYDVEREVAAVRRSGYPDGDRIVAMLRGGRFQPP
jgi:predicted phosphodiesterase